MPRHSFALLALCVCVLSAGLVDAAQTTVLRITVMLIDSNLTPRPVPRHVLMVSRADGAGAPVRLVTGFDGKVETRLDAGAYVIESDRPVDFQGRSYRWRQPITIAPGAAVSLDLSIDNAIDTAAAPPSAPPAPAPIAASAPPPAGGVPAPSASGQGSGRPASDNPPPKKLVPNGGAALGFDLVHLQGGGNAFGGIFDGGAWFGTHASGPAVGWLTDFAFERFPGIWVQTVNFGLRVGTVAGPVRPFGQFTGGVGRFFNSGCGNKCEMWIIAPGGGVDIVPQGKNIGFRVQADLQVNWPQGGARFWGLRLWGGIVFLRNKEVRDR